MGKGRWNMAVENMPPVCYNVAESHFRVGKGVTKMAHRFTAVFEQEGDWWIGYVEELPGANTQGATLEEARENLKEAVQLVLEANRELARREVEGRTVVREDLWVAA
jgi:predicted RNase H-like HicB family nuclease